MVLDLLRDIIPDKILDELLSTEEALKTGIVSIGYLESHIGIIDQGVEFDNQAGEHEQQQRLPACPLPSSPDQRRLNC